MTAKVRLIKNPFSREAETLAYTDYGSTLQDLIDNLDIQETLKKEIIIQKVDKELDTYTTIEPELYSEVFLKKDDNYIVAVKIRGGGGSGKQIITMIAMVAIMAVAFMVAGPMLGGYLGGTLGLGTAGSVAGFVVGAGATMYAGMELINALVPTPEVSNSSDYSYDSGRTLTNSSNQMSPYSPIPRIYGRTKFSPYKVAPDYTEVVGDDTYMRSLFCFGYGPLKISDIQIGTNSIDNYQEVEYEIREGWDTDEPISLYTGGIKQQGYNTKLDKNTPVVLTTLSNQDECSFDINFPFGTYAIYGSESNKRAANPVGFDINIRKDGGDWEFYTHLSYSYLSTSPYTKTERIKFPQKGTYDVSINLVSNAHGHDGSKNFNEAYLVNFRNIQYEYPVEIKGMALLAVRIKASEQLNGALDGVSALCESYLRKPSSIKDIPLSSGDKYEVFRELSSIQSKGDTASTALDSASDIYFKLSLDRGLYSNSNKYYKIKSHFKASWETESGSDNKDVVFEQSFGESGSKLEEEVFYINEVSQSININVEHLGDIGVWRESRYRLIDGEIEEFYAEYEEEIIAESVCVPSISYIGYKPKQEYSWKYVINRHPAWHVFDIITGSATDDKTDDSMIDIDSFINWEEHYPHWVVDKAIDGSYTKLEIINSMCSAGKAFFMPIAGKYTVVMDKIDKSPVAAISSRNSFNFQMTKMFQRDLHGFKVKYIDPDSDWTEQEVIVYNNGYDESNASVFEGLDSYGCTDRTMAWKFGKYMLAQYMLRPETYTVSQDIENMVVNVGDSVILYSDVIKTGIGSARIKEVFVNDDGRVNGIILDDKFYLPSGNFYNICLRSCIGKLESFSVKNNNAETDLIEFSNPLPTLSAPSVGDQVFLGLVDREGINCLVKRKDMGDDMSATLTLVPEAPEVHDESEVGIPPYDPEITNVPSFNLPKPMKPTVSNIISDERALIFSSNGSYQEAVSFLVQPQPGENVNISNIQVYVTNAGSPVTEKFSFPYSGNDQISVTGVEGGRNANVKVRYISDKSVASDWNEFEVSVSGKTNAPPDIKNLDRQGYNITWNYDDKPLDFAGFRVYYNHGYNTNKDQAVRGHSELLWTSPPFSTESLPKGVLTLFVVAVDTSGNESLVPAIISFNNGDVEYDNIISMVDFRAISFEGKNTNMELLDGDLVTMSESNFYNSDASIFYDNDEELFYKPESYGYSEYEFQVTNDTDIENAYIKLDWETEGVCKIFYRRDSKQQFYPNVEDGFYKTETDFFYSQDEHWYLMPDKLLVGKETVTFRVEFESQRNISRIKKLIAVVDAPDTSELLSNIEVLAEGTRLPITKKFKVINKAFLTLSGTGEVGAAKVLDYNLEGPMVRVYDFNGNPIASTINADVRGYM